MEYARLEFQTDKNDLGTFVQLFLDGFKPKIDYDHKDKKKFEVACLKKFSQSNFLWILF